MDIRITFRHKKSSQSLQDTIHDEVSKLEKFADNITSCHVILDTEGLNEKIEITMHAAGHEVVAHETAENLGKALDGVIEKVERQLKKLNEKIKSHK